MQSHSAINTYLLRSAWPLYDSSQPSWGAFFFHIITYTLTRPNVQTKLVTMAHFVFLRLIEQFCRSNWHLEHVFQPGFVGFIISNSWRLRGQTKASFAPPLPCCHKDTFFSPGPACLTVAQLLPFNFCMHWDQRGRRVISKLKSQMYVYVVGEMSFVLWMGWKDGWNAQHQQTWCFPAGMFLDGLNQISPIHFFFRH